MCKKRDESEVKTKSDNTFDGPVRWLVRFCIALVIFVVLWIGVDTYTNINYQNKVIHKLEEIQYVSAEVVKADTSVLVLSGKDIKELLDSTVMEQSTIMDSNNYLALILTLITLCVSLSVVIPYIVGRSISAQMIKDTVDELYTKDKQNSELKYQKYVDKLLVAEGHLSRMVSYVLLNSSRDKYQSELNNAKYDGSSHPYWAIGWASKSLIRYLKCFSGNMDKHKNKFVDDCVRYIVDANNAMNSQGLSRKSSNEAKEKMIRAYVDITDVIGFADSSQWSDVLTGLQKTNIRNAAKKLYLAMKSAGVSRNEIKDIAVCKSKYMEYMPFATREEYEKDLEKQMTDFEI